MSKGTRPVWVNVDMVEASAEPAAMVDVAKGILCEPHGFRAKLVKSAAVFLADVERVRGITIKVSGKPDRDEGYGGALRGPYPGRASNGEPGLDLDDFLKWQGYKTDGYGNVVE